MKPIALGPTEVAPGRPFTSVDHYRADTECLVVLIADLCAVLARATADSEELVPFEHIRWSDGGYAHRLIICDPPRLLEHSSLSAVGFFSERHTDIDISPLEKANKEVVEEFRAYPGVLSYGSIQLPEGHWANLVLHEEPATADEWRTSRVHADVVERMSPIHYKNVRIHNALLTAGLSDDPDIRIVRPKYFDYEDGEGWQAVRELPDGATL